jgi:hypothetical protein
MQKEFWLHSALMQQQELPARESAGSYVETSGDLGWDEWDENKIRSSEGESVDGNSHTVVFAVCYRTISRIFDQVFSHASRPKKLTVLKCALIQKRIYRPSRRPKFSKIVNPWSKWYSILQCSWIRLTMAVNKGSGEVSGTGVVPYMALKSSVYGTNFSIWH